MQPGDTCFGSPLAQACLSGSVEVVEWLLLNGSKMENLRGLFSFLANSNDNNRDICRLLLQHGVNWSKVEVYDPHNPLSDAIKRGNFTAARLLLADGADPNMGKVNFPRIFQT